MNIKSPYLLIVTVLTALMLGNLVSFTWPSLSAEERAAAVTKSKDILRAVGATIVLDYVDLADIHRSGVILRVPGLNQTTALQISDRQTLEALEAMFPNYRNHPKSDTAGAWESKYTIYLELSDGKTINLSVSAHGDGGADWSQGDGDHSVKGNIDDFVSQLFKRLSERKR
ncbi:MAG: hypothetical protein JWN70_6704 [Planctomycetaceae bacterium]|nr:hypothetical protein [Planctomycetaceae bacterium]